MQVRAIKRRGYRRIANTARDLYWFQARTKSGALHIMLGIGAAIAAGRGHRG